MAMFGWSFNTAAALSCHELPDWRQLRHGIHFDVQTLKLQA